MNQTNVLTASSVASTAYWIAAYRAQETARADAVFRDPFAARLAGAIDPPSLVPAWPLIARTKVIDDVVLRSVQSGTDLVLNLAAGLDTRPYRLPLPAALEWVEADLSQIVAYKADVLAAAKPNCQFRREVLDLGDVAARSEFLDRVTASSKRVLVITEGLLMYLNDESVVALGHELSRRPNTVNWVADLLSPGLLRRVQRATRSHLGPVSPLRFAPENGISFFEPVGWTAIEVTSLLQTAGELKRLPPVLQLLRHLPEPSPRRLGRWPWSAVCRFAQRSSLVKQQ